MTIQRFTVLSESPVKAINAPYTGEWVKYDDHIAALAASREETLEEAAAKCREIAKTLFRHHLETVESATAERCANELLALKEKK